MIRLLNTKTIAGIRYPAGSIATFDTQTESQLIATADADRNIDFSASRISPTLVAQSYAGWTRSSVNAAGDIDATVLASIVIPGGLMGMNSVLRITLDWSYTNSASTKVLAMDWGGVNISAPSATASSGMKSLVEIANKNSLSIQTIQNNNNYGAASRLGDMTKDTSGDVLVDIKVRWTTPAASEAITLIGYSIWHYPGNKND
jgi:hypothetical protein